MIKRVFDNDKSMYYCTLCTRPFKPLHEANEHARHCGQAVPTQPVFRSYTTAATFELKDDATQFYTNEARTWQGLTDEEQQELYKKHSMDGWGIFYAAIEAALKKKNA